MTLSVIDTALLVLAAINGLVFGLFWFDKVQARNHGWRVPEQSLLLAVLVGGVGAWFAQHILRHKTRKEPFRTRLGVILTVHLLTVAALLGAVLSLT